MQGYGVIHVLHDARDILVVELGPVETNACVDTGDTETAYSIEEAYEADRAGVGPYARFVLSKLVAAF